MATPTLKEEVKAYNDSVTIIFYPNSHMYKLDGVNLISVTGAVDIIDKPGLMPWAVGLMRDRLIQALENGESLTDELIAEAASKHKLEKEKAANIGKIFHDFAEAFARAQIDGTPKPTLPELPEETEEEQRIAHAIYSCINGFLDWVVADKVNYVSAEFFIFSKKYGYVGKCDALAYVNGVLTILDYKTSNGVYPSHWYQASGYTLAHWEEHGKEVRQYMILNFNKQSGEFLAYPPKIDPDEMAADQSAFLSALFLKQRDNLYMKRKKETKP